MSDERKGEESEAIKQAKLRALQLAQSFEAVFGQPRKRTDAQRLVLEHLEKCCGGGEDGNAFRFTDATGDGWKTALSAAHLDGAKSVLRVVNRQLSIASKPKQAEDRPKPKIVRK